MRKKTALTKALKPLNDALDAFKRNFWLSVMLSIPMLIAYILMVMLPAPTYISLGSLYLRSGSLGEINIIDIAIVFIGYIVAMFIITNTVVDINILIREEKTRTKLREEIVKGIWKYSGKLLGLFVLLELALFVVQMLTIDMPYHYILYPIIGIVLFSLVFFVPNAVVIDNLKLNKAFLAGIKMLRYHWDLIVLWMLTGFILISATEAIFFFIGLPSIAILIVNSLLIFPYLIILQAQLYMRKYPLAD